MARPERMTAAAFRSTINDVGDQTKAKKPKQRDYAGELSHMCTLAGLPKPVREHRFHKTRRWRFDLAWPDQGIAIEIDGGAFVGGRHTSGSGFRADCEKMSEAAVLGWQVLRVLPEWVPSGRALGFALRAHGKETDK